MASQEPSPTAPEPSSWSRLPSIDSEDSTRNGDPAASPVVTRAAQVSASVAGVRAALLGGAEKVSTRVGERFQQATAALGSPAPDIESLYASADLPELTQADPLASLALRLDRESDLWRGLALRALSRAAWTDRIVQIAGVFMGIGTIALAVIAGLGALFGAGDALARLLLIGGAVGALASGAAILTWIAGGVRRAQREIAREAMLHASLAELRLHRLGVVSALRQVDPDAGRQALSRLERDVSAPPR